MKNLLLFSDPVVSANIYASGLLDSVMLGVLVPFWHDLREYAPDEQSYFWVVRYSRNGEHLKVRIHGRESDRDSLRRRFVEYVERYFKNAHGMPPAVPRSSRTDVPPIDPEDRMPVSPPDRSLLWTTYQRSPVSLASAPWLSDHTFAARSCACLGRSCELVMDAMDSGILTSTSARQKLLIKALLSGLGALGWRKPERAAGYPKYHRDWLLRFFIDDEAGKKKVLQEFIAQTKRMAGTMGPLRELAQKHLVPKSEQTDSETPWARDLAGLSSFLESFHGSAQHQVDPFTSDVSFPPIFKVFHGFANQLGLRPMDEAYAHHLILAAVEPGQAESGIVAGATS